MNLDDSERVVGKPEVIGYFRSARNTSSDSDCLDSLA
jgi:hypothetical protein